MTVADVKPFIFRIWISWLVKIIHYVKFISMQSSASLILKMVWVGVWNAYQNGRCHFLENHIFLFSTPRTSNPTTWFRKKSITILNSILEDTFHEEKPHPILFKSFVKFRYNIQSTLPFMTVSIYLHFTEDAGHSWMPYCYRFCCKWSGQLPFTYTCLLYFCTQWCTCTLFSPDINLRKPYQYIIHVAYFDRNHNARVVWHYIF